MMTLRERAEIWGLLKDLPDEASISAEEAGVYLNVEPKTMSRMRGAGEGPVYIQPKTKEGTKARNQKITYIMGDLRAWRAAQRITSTMEAAEVRGLAFASLPDLLEEQPFWIRTCTEEVKGGMGREKIQQARTVIVGHVLTVDDDAFKRLVSDPNADIEYLSLDEAMKRSWVDLEARKPFQAEYIAALQRSIEAAELHSI